MVLLTAEEARDMARAKDPSAAVSEILNKVAVAAGEGEYEVVIRDYGFNSGKYYSTEDKWPEFGKTIVKELRGLGYSCRVWSGGGQFLDMWLTVSWQGE